MIGSLHRMGSRVRNSPFLVRQEWLWRKVEPLWQRTFEQIFQRQGMPARINGDEFRLTYEFAARYGRADKQAYEPDIYRAFVDRIRTGMTVLDIGAHVGFFALGAAKRVGPQGRVYAFEPAPENASILERHISFNGFRDRVEIVRKVVSDINGVVPFYTNGETMAASILRENLEGWSLQHFDSPTVELEAPSVSLDRFCADANIKPDVI